MVLNNTHQIDLVLPVSKKDIPRARLCLETVLTFFSEPGDIYVICPDDAFDRAEEVLGNLPVRIVRETELLPQLVQKKKSLLWRALFPRKGWYIQQVVKLAAAELVATEYFLTLDADIMLTQTLDAADLFFEEKALSVKLEKFRHRIWYRVASLILGLNMTKSEYGITPSLLNRDVCRAVVCRIEKTHGRNWIDILLSRFGWSEYALYHTIIENSAEFRELHHYVDWDSWFGPCAWSDWTIEEEDKWSVDQAFAKRARGWFTIFSSYCSVPLEDIAVEVRKKLRISQEQQRN